MAQMVSNQLAMWEAWVQYLGREDPLKKGIATQSSILAWRIPWTEEPGRLHTARNETFKKLPQINTNINGGV